MDTIPVIDIFAGPGGLGEGFASLKRRRDGIFGIHLSIEKEQFAYRTLKLRSFFRRFETGAAPEDYYSLLRGDLREEELYSRHPEQHAAAEREAWHAELGHSNFPHEVVDKRIRNAVGDSPVWVLIGGPPCQAYSIVGRSRRSILRRNDPAVFEADERHYLYQQYLRILVVHRPPVFVMENVKGLLSSTIEGSRIINRIVEDLREPSLPSGRPVGLSYRLYSFSRKADDLDLFGHPVLDPQDFIIESEAHGIPQARHRVIILGIRSDIGIRPTVLKKRAPMTMQTVIADLPMLRSRLSREADSGENWVDAIRRVKDIVTHPDFDAGVRKAMLQALDAIHSSLPTGDTPLTYQPQRPAELVRDWLRDPRLRHAPNHESRFHMASDLHRYLFVACYAYVHGQSPILADFPKALLPTHSNVSRGVDDRVFADRFRVQLYDRPATTITSHIAKDGHYFIHPDPLQCRSLTVREAARIQTFPDNYLFLGPRTAQYQQVGNAVPPLLARQLAEIVCGVLGRWKQGHT
jgi:DNA (cytosine-5)-methyltransferase 1